MAPPSTASILVELLGPTRFEEVDEALIDYIDGVVSDEGEEEEDRVQAVAALLEESVGGDAEEAENMVRELMLRRAAHGREPQEACARTGGGQKRREAVSISDSVGGASIASSIALPDDEAALMRRAARAAVVPGDLNLMTEKDERKLAARKEREEQRRHNEMTKMLAMSGVGDLDAVGGGGAGAGNGDVRLERIDVTVAGKELIRDSSVVLSRGHKYGLVGQNGTGKTTLLKHISARAIEGMSRSTSVLHVEQEVEADDSSALECVLAANAELAGLLREEEACVLRTSGADDEGDGPRPSKSDGDGGAPSAPAAAAASLELGRIYDALARIDADGLRASAARILAGLGFSAAAQDRPTKSFSGGWRMRIALARGLFMQPDLLLLDEPTNHLDLHAALWLEGYLVDHWSGTVLLVSHSRDFLNAVATDILHLHEQKLTVYRGSNYDSFQATRLEKLRNQKKAAENSERRRKEVQSFIDRFRYNAKRASIVQSRIKALERMAECEIMADNVEYEFKFPDPGAKLQPPVISLTDVRFAYDKGAAPIFDGLNLGIDMDSRIAIVGANGAGKTTLLNLIRGELCPTSGVCSISPNARIAIFSQHHVDGLDLRMTPLEYMIRSFPSTDGLKHEERMRGHLDSFGIPADLAQQRMYTLSGGQKSRVAFAKVTFNRPAILLLDEPSNHLDMEAVDALIKGLLSYQGGILMVSHDEYLIKNVVDELLIVEDGRARHFQGDFCEYKKHLKGTRV